MKVLAAFVFMFSSYSAMAVDYKCHKQVTNKIHEGAQISTWPRLLVGVSRSECTDVGGGMEMCSSSGETLATDHGVCFSPVDVNKNCYITEGLVPEDAEVAVTCNNGIQLEFDMQSSKISCFERGVLRKSWDVGSCVKD